MSDSAAKTCRLSELKTSEEGVIVKLSGHGSFRNRIMEMGFVKGERVKVIKNAPLQDPVEYEIMGYRIALRRSEAERIEVTRESGAARKMASSENTISHHTVNRQFHEQTQRIHVALVGNPNSGKTSMYNVLSGSRERVGNYGGVTVDAKSAVVNFEGYKLELVDLPGTYSVTEYSPEELFVRKHLLDKMPDVVINVVDASNLERNLYLTTQLIDMNIKVVIALNMYDELKESGASLDYGSLGSMLGIPIVPTVASRGEGMKDLMSTVVSVFEDNEPMVRHIHINYGQDIEESISVLQNEIWENKDITARYSSRYLAIKLIEGDNNTLELLRQSANFERIRDLVASERTKLEKIYHEDPQEVIADAKYGFIRGALSETYRGPEKDRNEKTHRIDKVMTNKVWGIPIFLFLMWVMFQTTFTLGGYPMEWMEAGVGWLGNLISGAMSEGPLRDLLVDGIIAGVGGVIVFLPNILILFFFISIMEDTGYMARAAFIMDKLMHRIGLHGKSFIPLLMGFGCNVPAIMATRTLESRKDRILTMLIIPFMSCSARLPVFVLLISAFFPRRQGLILLSIYMIGIVVAAVSSIIFKKFFFPKEEAPFVMELPPYRIPTLRSVSRHTWSKGVQYLKKMGTVILVASVIVWALGHYPERPELPVAEQQEQSYIGRLGHAIEPTIRPLGFDWKMGVAILTGFAAKEIVVSTMAVLYSAGDEGSLPEILQQSETFDQLTAYSFMIFILLYFPCVAAIAAIRKEAGWKWALLTVVYTTALAWVLSFAVCQIGALF